MMYDDYVAYIYVAYSLIPLFKTLEFNRIQQVNMVSMGFDFCFELRLLNHQKPSEAFRSEGFGA